MGYSTTFYVGAFVMLSSGLTVEKQETRHVCPKCQQDRSSKFCAVCGSEVEARTKIKKVKITEAYEIIDHIGYESDDFMCYGGPAIVLNVGSENIHHLDRDDNGEIVIFSEQVKDKAVAEVRRYGEKELFKLLEARGVEYEVVYGATVSTY